MHELTVNASRQTPSVRSNPSQGFRLDSRRVVRVDGLLSFRSGCGLTAAERRAIDDERRDLRGKLLVAATAEDVSAEVLPILNSRGSRSPGEATDFRTVAYLEALTGLPRWALVEASRRINDGTAQDIDRRFVPTPAEIAHVARQKAAAARAQLARLEEFLAAPEDDPVPTPAEAERIAAKAAAASRLISATVAKNSMARVVGPAPSCRSEHDRAREARELARLLVPMTDAEIEALKPELGA